VYSYIIRRVLTGILTFLLVGIIAFTLMRLTPGDPAHFFVSERATEAQIEQVRERLGLDRTPVEQFGIWFSGVLRGDLGQSMYMGNRPVTTLFFRRALVSIPLILLGTFFSVILAIPIGVISALKRKIKKNSIVDKVLTFFVLFGISMPDFWFGLLLIFFISVGLGWFPAQGYVRPTENIIEAFRHLALPAIALGYPRAALIARMVRSRMLEVLSLDYIRTARSKGIREMSVIIKHALKNTMIEVLSTIQITIVSIIGGIVVIETVFNLPGFGRLIVDSIGRRDYPVIQGSLLIVGMGIVILSLLTDILYGVFDPRIKYD